MRLGKQNLRACPESIKEGCFVRKPEPSPCEMERQIPCGVRSRAAAKRSAVRRCRRSNLSRSKSEDTSANKKHGTWGTVASALVNQGVLQSDDRTNWVTAFEAAQSSSHPLCGTDSNVWRASKCNRRRHCLPVKKTNLGMRLPRVSSQGWHAVRRACAFVQTARGDSRAYYDVA
jgi:hypothetical protein